MSKSWGTPPAVFAGGVFSAPTTPPRSSPAQLSFTAPICQNSLVTTKRRKWLIAAATAIALLLAADATASLLVRTRRVNRALTARLAAAFGRPVEVGSYSFSLLEGPRLEADSVTVGEDPHFGHEYFLRAQSVAVTLRWTSLLRGRLAFGSFSLSQPNLNVVDVGGRWNLEDWLPPAPPRAASHAAGARSKTPRLYRIEVDGGRINFKRGVDKLPFALVDVSGSVDERAPGRWALSLDAQPMRAAVNLQEAGTLHLSGEVGGTSVRLRPARLHLRWDNASLSDVLRLAFGHGYGVRGHEDLDLRAGSSGGRWRFELDAHARGIHRWDFVAEPGNPNLNLRLAGDWSPGEGKLTFTGGQIVAPASFIALTGGIDWPVAGEDRAGDSGPGPRLHLRFTTAGVSAQDLLAWYRSFHKDISPRLRASGWLQGTLDLAGWPPRIRAADLTAGGLRVQGRPLKSPVNLSAAALHLSGAKASLLLTGLDFGPRTGSFRIAGSASDLGSWKFRLDADGSTANLGALSRAAETLGARLSPYWKQFGGGAKIQLHWTGSVRPLHQTLRASLELRDAIWREPSLPARVSLESAQVRIAGSRFRVDVRRASTMGADWHGWLERSLPAGPWRFDLAADSLNVRALAAKLQPQPQRPSLLERIFGFGHAAGSPPLWLATLDASGEVSVNRLSVPPLALEHVTGRLAIRHGRLELSRARGRFYGGGATGLLVFSVRKRAPVWQLSAHLEDASLAEISRAIAGQSSPARFSGRLSGSFDASARGATAVALRDSLKGEARLRVLGAADHRINWLSTLETGDAVAGRGDFREVSAEIRLAAGKVTFDRLSLSGRHGQVAATGTVDLARDGALAVDAHFVPPPGAPDREARTWQVTGTASTPRVRVHQPSSQPVAATPH
jgi:uncharacterized protein involved in outer membrane biogenesis